jgi:hypothetical protein
MLMSGRHADCHIPVADAVGSFIFEFDQQLHLEARTLRDAKRSPMDDRDADGELRKEHQADHTCSFPPAHQLLGPASTVEICIFCMSSDSIPLISGLKILHFCLPVSSVSQINLPLSPFTSAPATAFALQQPNRCLHQT